MTVSSSESVACDSGSLKICDSSSHQCWDTMPTSASSTNQYTLTITNNDAFSMSYSMTMQAKCPGGGPIDYTICEPVLGGGVYPTACTFDTSIAGPSNPLEEYLGINGCSCLQFDSTGLSLCWDGSDSGADFTNNVQDCSGCPLPPSNSPTRSYSASTSFSASETATISVTSSYTSSTSFSASQTTSQTQSPSPWNTSGSESSPQTGLFGLPKIEGYAIIGGIPVVVIVAALVVACRCYKRRAQGPGLDTLKEDEYTTFDGPGQPLDADL